MAWIAKNSAGTQIERRDTPYLDDDIRAELSDKYLPRYPTRQAATLPALHLIQEKHGYIPYQAMEELGEFLELPASTIHDTATFYEEYFLQPKGEYVIWVCQSIACELCDEGRITNAVIDHLGIVPGETTEDGKFTLMKAECLGACGSAPVALLGEKLVENLTPESIVKEIDALR